MSLQHSSAFASRSGAIGSAHHFFPQLLPGVPFYPFAEFAGVRVHPTLRCRDQQPVQACPVRKMKRLGSRQRFPLATTTKTSHIHHLLALPCWEDRRERVPGQLEWRPGTRRFARHSRLSSCSQDLLCPPLLGRFRFECRGNCWRSHSRRLTVNCIYLTAFL
jgi:hypothetical protein